MTHENITTDNIFLNIDLKVKEAFKTDEDFKDDWKRGAKKTSSKN